MRKSKVIPALSGDARLRRLLRRHLSQLGFQHGQDGTLAPPGEDKSALRALHGPQRIARVKSNRSFIEANIATLDGAIANGSEIEPSRIQFELRRVDADTPESVLFRLACLTWSVPVSNGFGRRLRYLVWDKHHNRLAGLIALGDPVFNLSVRDRLIGWNAFERAERLSHVLDAYVLGALPPYNLLLGGKIVACLVRTQEVYDDFLSKYGSSQGIISGKNKRSRLLLVTTSSSLGRSSVYNRLKLHDHAYFKSIGYTDGWGHFHISDELFAAMRAYLQSLGHAYVNQNRFGQGPNWRLRTIREALKALGVSEATLHHGVKREVFMSEFASNSLAILKGTRRRPKLEGLRTAEEVAALAVDRWLLPRAERQPEFRLWTKTALLSSLLKPAIDGMSVIGIQHAY